MASFLSYIRRTFLPWGLMTPKKILLVDDETAVLFAYRKVLERPGVNVDAAESKKETIRLLDRCSYDVAILDLRLSGGDCEEGFELLSVIKAKSPSTKIMLITAYGNPDIQEKATSLGADFYFEKPVSTRFIQEALRLAGVPIQDDEISKVVWKFS